MAPSRRNRRTFAFGGGNSPSFLRRELAWAKKLASAWRTWLIPSLLIASLTFWIYWPSLNGGFIWDDAWYLTTNPLMRGWLGLWKLWYRPGSWVEYYPIQETVQWTQWQMWGDHTLGYHLTNVILHIGNALLVWWLLAKFRLRYAWVGGLLFAVHPVQVESVAYISELKNTLSMPFFLLSTGSWIDFEESHAKVDYQKALLFYLTGMLCKISMSPFPALILLYAWWKRGRIRFVDWKASAPFFLISLVLGALTVWAGQVYSVANHALVPETPLTGIMSRIDATGLNATAYFARCFLPVDVLFVYSQWPLHPESFLEYLPWLFWIGAGSWLWVQRQTWGRHGILGLGFFFVFLSPFLGLITASYMNFIWVMDHFLYIPIIGLVGLFVAALEGIKARLTVGFSRGLWVMIAGLVVLMSGASHAFAGLFVNEEALWKHVLDRNPGIWLAHDDLGSYLADHKRYKEAMVQSEAAIALKPLYWDGYYNLGVSLDKLGNDRDAERMYRKSIELNPQYVKAYMNLGDILERSGNLASAEQLFKQGLKVTPGNDSLSNNLGTIYVRTHRLPDALELFRQAVEEDPESAQLHYNYGNTLSAAGNFSDAASELETAVALDPSLAWGHENLGVSLAHLDRLPEAIVEFEAALQIDARLPSWHDNLAFAFAQTGRLEEARQQFELALRIAPDDRTALASLPKVEQLEMQQNSAGQK